MRDAINAEAGPDARRRQYRDIHQGLQSMLADETDWVAAMATVVCELHNGFDYYDWTGFYRHVDPEVLVVGPYQGSHGCLRIDFDRGICGACARTGEVQLVDDVHSRPDHIACSSSTESEVVVPVTTRQGELLAVLDVDSDLPAAFSESDAEELQRICDWLGEAYASSR
jgi:GAF domain-containing protein